MTPVDEQDLREHFERRANALTPGPLPATLLRHAVRRDRQRRTGLVLATAVAAVAAVGLVGLRPWAGQDRGTPATRTTTPTPTASTTPAPRLPDQAPGARWRGSQLPTAGDLARDTRWLAAANARITTLENAQNQGTSATWPVHLIFAGRLPVGAAVIAAREGFAERETLTLYSPTGRAQDLTSPPMALRGLSGSLAPGGPRDTDVSAAFLAPDGTRVFAVVPFDGGPVEVSSGPRLDPDGRVTRTWTSVPLRDGAAVGRLGPADLQLPSVRIGGRDGSFLAAQIVMSLDDWRVRAAWLRQHWTIGTLPDQLLGAFTQLSFAVDLRSTRIEPVLHARLAPSNAEVMAAVVHLPGGGALQVVSTRDDRKPAALQPPVTVPGRAVAARNGTAPIGWLEYLSDADDGGIHGRARIAMRDAARIEVRDVGAQPCTPGDHLLGRGTPDANGLTTIVVDLPERCEELVPYNIGNRVGYRTIEVIAFDAAGRELGRGPLQQTYDAYLPDTAPAG